jgi:hypothetical protein
MFRLSELQEVARRRGWRRAAEVSDLLAYWEEAARNRLACGAVNQPSLLSR